MNVRMLLAVTLLASISLHLSAMTTTGQQSASANDGHKGLELDISSLKLQARAGDAKAQYKLGWSYMTGSGVAKDYEKALNWYNNAAKQGSADAEFVLTIRMNRDWASRRTTGRRSSIIRAQPHKDTRQHRTTSSRCTSEEKGSGKIFIRLAAWYEKAADHEPTAQCNLASLYLRKGNGEKCSAGSNMVQSGSRARVRSGRGKSRLDVLHRDRPDTRQPAGGAMDSGRGRTGLRPRSTRSWVPLRTGKGCVTRLLRCVHVVQGRC